MSSLGQADLSRRLCSPARAARMCGVHDLRASDADRDATTAALRQHHLSGRIDELELEQRLGEALTAQTVGQLQGLTRDLGTARVAQPIDPEANRVRGFGTRQFKQQYEIPGRPADVYGALITHILPAFVEAGYDIVSTIEPSTIVFELKERSPWWLLFGVLPYLVSEERSRVVFSINQIDQQASRMTISGRAPRSVRKWLLRFDRRTTAS